jgi:Phage capsid family
MRLATCNATPDESASISNTNKCLKTTSFDVMFFLCDDDVQDNITGAQIEQQLIRMTGDQLNNELELYGIMGNTNGSYFATAAPPAPAVVANEVMQARDNIYRQLQQGHIVNAQSLTAGPLGAGTLTYHALNCLQRALPTKYRTNPERRRIYMNPDLWQDFAELHQQRETDLGDLSLLGPPPRKHQDVPIVQVPMIPTNIQRCGCQSLPSANGTFAFTTVPSNMVFGVEKNVTFERWRDGPRHLTWFIWTVRVDFLIYNEDATALLDCVTLSNCGGGTCGVVPLPAGRCFSCIGTGVCP